MTEYNEERLTRPELLVRRGSPSTSRQSLRRSRAPPTSQNPSRGRARGPRSGHGCARARNHPCSRLRKTYVDHIVSAAARTGTHTRADTRLLHVDELFEIKVHADMCALVERVADETGFGATPSRCVGPELMVWASR